MTTLVVDNSLIYSKPAPTRPGRSERSCVAILHLQEHGGMDSTLVISLVPLRLWRCSLTSSMWPLFAATLLFCRIGSISSRSWTKGMKDKGRKRQKMAHFTKYGVLCLTVVSVVSLPDLATQ